MLHGVPLAAEFARVQVDNFIETFANCPLPNVREGDEMQTIGDAAGCFVQWPKKDIILLSLPYAADCSPSDAPTFPPVLHHSPDPEVEEEVLGKQMPESHLSLPALPQEETTNYDCPLVSHEGTTKVRATRSKKCALQKRSDIEFSK